jgi:hypothetical protein
MDLTEHIYQFRNYVNIATTLKENTQASPDVVAQLSNIIKPHEDIDLAAVNAVLKQNHIKGVRLDFPAFDSIFLVQLPVQTKWGLRDSPFIISPEETTEPFLSANNWFEKWMWKPMNNFFDDTEEIQSNFWDTIGPYDGVAYHATDSDNLESIKEIGLLPKNDSRGISNDNVGKAVFASLNMDESGSYGDAIVIINLTAMKQD